MRIAILSPIAWRTPPRADGPWELVASHPTEGLVEAGHDVTLFATADSRTRARLEAVAPAPYEEEKILDPKVWECLHIAHLMEQADRFDLIHNHFDFLPLTYSRLISTPMVTTIYGFSSPKILPVYRRYNDRVHCISISDADRSPELDYLATVYNGVDPDEFTFIPRATDYLLFLGRIHDDKGTREAIWIARKVGPAGPELRDRLLGSALALLHPINFDEPFGLTVVESMLTGTPVIAKRRGSMQELVLDGETGFLVEDAREAADAALRLRREPDAIDRRRCRDWAMQRFTVSRMVEGYLRAGSGPYTTQTVRTSPEERYKALPLYSIYHILSHNTIRTEDLMNTTSQRRPYLYGALSGLLLTASVAVTDQFFGTSTTFPRAATGLLQLVGLDLSGWEFAQVRDGALTGLAFPNWQLLFVIGIGLGAFIASRITGTFKAEAMPPMWVARFGESKRTRIVYSILGGMVAMIGARMAGGCPSGHGISGFSQLGVSSLIALVMFFVGGVVTARILYRGESA